MYELFNALGWRTLCRASVDTLQLQLKIGNVQLYILDNFEQDKEGATRIRIKGTVT
jgi:hypothetical protein